MSMTSKGMKAVRRALLSVSDKSRLGEFARFLADGGAEIFATSSTHKFLNEHEVPAKPVDALTGMPEMMRGRVRTLHPKIHGGLLACGEGDVRDARKHGIEMLDLLVVNLYPFEETVARPDCAMEEAVENIDVGGPAMLRAAAKNHRRVVVVCDPDDYAGVREALEGGGVSESLRRALALKAFRKTAAYDAAIVAYFAAQSASRAAARSRDAMPEEIVAQLRRAGELAYGENPHQCAAFYVDAKSPAARPELLQGGVLSYNNIADVDAALACAFEFEAPACAVIKHATPCGVACADAVREAYVRAFEADELSAFGGVIALNRPVDEATAAEVVSRQFAEALVAPAFSDEALRRLADKKKLRVLRAPPPAAALQIRTVGGGYLAQTPDVGGLDRASCEVVTKRAPSDDEWRDLLFAWGVVGHVRSNAIVLARELRTVGVGGGQPNRVGAVRIAANSASGATVLASDAFFPFRDGVDVAADAGVTALIQPGGSVNDDKIVAVADERGMAMVFTRKRRFKH